jgi:protein-disulfide isomerase
VNITRRDTLLMAAAASMSAAITGVARADDSVTIDPLKLMAPAGDVPDRVFGKKDAKVTMIEYLSPTCPHCAAFDQTVFPQLRTKYVDSGKIAYIPRPFMRNVLDAVVFMLAESAAASAAPATGSAPAAGAPASPASDAANEKYFLVLDTYFKTQDQWVVSNTPKDAMQQIALQLGFTKDSFDKALTNQTLFNALEKVRDQAVNDFKVSGTPTFFINGKQLVGEQTLDQISAVIDPLLA